MSELGQVSIILVCQNSSESSSTACPTGMRLVTKEAYILEPTSKQYLDTLQEPFNYEVASGLFFLAFTSVVGIWLASKHIGAVLKRIR